MRIKPRTCLHWQRAPTHGNLQQAVVFISSTSITGDAVCPFNTPLKNLFTASLSFLIPSEQQTPTPLDRPEVSGIWCNEHLKEQAPFSPFPAGWFSVPRVSTLRVARQTALAFHSPSAPDSLLALSTPQPSACTPHCREESWHDEIAEVTSLEPSEPLSVFLFLFKVQPLFRNLAAVTPVHTAARSQ